MKKLLLSMLIVLGTIASTQAQSNGTRFSFACSSGQTIEGGYTVAELATLAELGFTPGISINGAPNLQGTINYSPASAPTFSSDIVVSISYNATPRRVEVGENVIFSHYSLTGHGFTPLYASDAANVIVLIEALMSPAPVDNSPQYSVFETQVRQWNFENQGSIQIVEWDDATGIGSFYPANTETDYSISFFNGRWAAEDQSTEYSDAFGDTLAELMVIVLARH